MGWQAGFENPRFISAGDRTIGHLVPLANHKFFFRSLSTLYLHAILTKHKATIPRRCESTSARHKLSNYHEHAIL